jgi:hypothetical protein
LPTAVFDPALAPFASVLTEPALHRIAHGALAWIRAQGAEGSSPAAEARLARLVVATSVYARLCAPTVASDRAFDVAARFTLVFFLVDDAALAELPAIIGGGQSPWSIGPYTPALRAWLADFHERERVGPRLRDRFDRAYHDYLEARRREHAHGARALGVDEHWELRRRTIFMDPYLDHWMISLGLELEPAAEAAFAEARALAIDLVLLANDLGSAERDRRGGESPEDLNLLHTYERESGWSPAEALERLIAMYGALVGRYRVAIDRAVAAAPGAHAAGYADLLTGVVDGNLGSLRALHFRYPRVGAIVDRLVAARPAAGS